MYKYIKYENIIYNIIIQKSGSLFCVIKYDE